MVGSVSSRSGSDIGDISVSIDSSICRNSLCSDEDESMYNSINLDGISFSSDEFEEQNLNVCRDHVDVVVHIQ